MSVKTNKLKNRQGITKTMLENYYWEVRTVDGRFRGFITGRTKHKVERKLIWLRPNEKLIVGRNISKYANKYNSVSKYTSWQRNQQIGRCLKR